VQTRAVSRSASSLKTLSKAGWLCRSLLKSGFEMIKTSMAVQARTVAFRVRSESKAISPKYSPRPIENNLEPRSHKILSAKVAVPPTFLVEYERRPER